MQKFIYFFTNVLIVSLLFISCKKKNKFTDSNEYSKEHERLIESLKFNENGPNYPPGYQKVAFQLMIDRMNNPPLSSKNNQGGKKEKYLTRDEIEMNFECFCNSNIISFKSIFIL